MIAIVSLLAAQGDVPQNPWPFVIIGYVVMGLGLVAVAVFSVVRARRLARDVPAGQRRWLEHRAAEVAATKEQAPAEATEAGTSTA